MEGVVSLSNKGMEYLAMTVDVTNAFSIHFIVCSINTLTNDCRLLITLGTQLCIQCDESIIREAASRDPLATADVLV